MQPSAANGKFRCEATLERELRARGFHAVAGVDEVGRGALFGPVFAGAVILSETKAKIRVRLCAQEKHRPVFIVSWFFT